MNISKILVAPKGNAIVRQMKQNKVAINQEVALFGSCGVVSGMGAAQANVENAASIGVMVPVFGTLFSATIGNINYCLRNIFKLKPEYNKIVERANKIYNK